jgi:acetate kinase
VAVLVVNAGSTSLKLNLVDGDRATVVESLEVECEAVAHRVVHGGEALVGRAAWVVDHRVEAALELATPIAPLHNEPMLRALRDARAAQPDVPHVAVMDSYFHHTIPIVASVYALPRRFHQDSQIVRYGFHGLSVQWTAERIRVPRLVVCHLGGGCSITAVRDGRSVDTTMGFTPLEGVPMATRSGSVDPGALLYLLRTGRETVESLDHALEHESGLLGLSGISGDVRELEESRDPNALVALEVFEYRVAAAVAAMAAALDGLDALVFTAGVGEHSARVRSVICARLGFLGVELDEKANAEVQGDAEIAADGSAVRVAVVTAREELVAARATRELLGLESP